MGEYAEYDIEQMIERFERRAEQAEQKRQKQFICHSCGKRFATDQGLSDHKKDKHD